MKATRSEELLWRASEVEPASDEPLVRDELLRSYRAGTLANTEAERVEAALSRSGRARARMAEMAGVTAARPPDRIRRRIFGEAVSPWYWRRGSGVAWAAAAAVAALLIVPFASRFLVNDGAGQLRRTLPPGLAFDVRVEGLAPLRSEGDRLPIAHPDTSVRIVLEPKEAAVSGLSFGLYRQEGNTLLRLMPSNALRVEESRGSVTFTATAESLVGRVPGDHEFFAVVAAGSDLPDRVAIDSRRTAEESLKSASEGLVYRSVLTVLDPNNPDPQR